MDQKTVEKLSALYRDLSVVEKSISKMLDHKNTVGLTIEFGGGPYPSIEYKHDNIIVDVIGSNRTSIMLGNDFHAELNTDVRAAIITGQLRIYRLLLEQIRSLGGEVTDAFESLVANKPRSAQYAMIATDIACGTQDIRVWGPFSSSEEALDKGPPIGIAIKMTPPET